MPDYSKSKIYKIVPTCEYEEGDEYFGSTIEPLSKRMSQHNIKNKCTSGILFKKYGIENCKIELVEEFPCDNRKQLLKKEGEYIRANKCVNKNIAGRTIKERYDDNAEQIKEYNNQYYLDNIEQIKEQTKQYRLNNAEQSKEYQKQYKIDNFEKIKEYQKQYRLSHKFLLDK